MGALGKVMVTILDAQSLHDSQTFGKQDPYLVVQVSHLHHVYCW
jgi:uncharacterized protein YciI